MAKKETRDDREHSPDDSGKERSDESQSRDEVPLDDTIRVDQEDSTPDIRPHDAANVDAANDDAANDDAIEYENSDSPHGSGETTLIPDRPESQSRSAGSDGSAAAEGTEEGEATIGHLDSTVGGDALDGPQQPNLQSTSKSVTSGNPDETVMGDSSPSRRGPAIYRSGGGQRSRSGRDRGDSTDVDVGSIMTSSAIGKTVNPRELSAQDATLWSSAVGEQQTDPTVLPPAIQRSFSERQFELLRRCDVAPLKSDPAKASDFRLVRKLGQGGMGDVFVARQGSLDRLLALKLIKPIAGKKRDQLLKTGKLEAVEEERRQQFLSEAIVTGDLDHPNIVPIHDVGLTSKNELFYAMKRVVGTPWSDVIKEKSQDENLEILLKAADAIGFAHTRGVVHRDIKPENIMLGDFGVVMVMDWGLALPTSDYEKQESIFSSSGLGGTPAFMAPEMATGPLERIGPAADIYLLGATLFMVITGQAPHHANNVTECLRAVRENRIREVPEAKHGELLDIALKAMAADPGERYPDVESFQHAIRDYRSHAESISLTQRAAEDLDHGKRTQAYNDFSRAAFRFEEAIKFWEGNEKAHQGLAETRLVHAAAAYDNGDFDLGLSLLDENDSEHQPLLEKLRSGLRERESHQKRLSVFRMAAAAMLAFIIVGGSVAMYVINTKYKEAQDARDDATLALRGEKQAKLDALASAESEKKAKEDALQAGKREEAAKKTALAALANEKTAKQEAIDSAAAEAKAKQEAIVAAQMERAAKETAEGLKVQAEAARDAARTAQRQAESLRARAQYEEYVSKIGLAKARLERNEADGAREILEQIRDLPVVGSADAWEWRWLWRQANQSVSSEPTGAAVIDLSVAASGKRGAVVVSGGRVDLITLENGIVTGRRPVDATRSSNLRATSVAFSPDETVLAVGSDSGEIHLIDASDQTTVLTAHRDRVLDLQFSPDGLLVSGSADRTVRVWDPSTGTELTRDEACWHISPVVGIATMGRGSAFTVAAAISDNETGRIVVWDLSRDGDALSVRQRGTFAEHRHPVSSVALSRGGSLAASGDIDGNVFLWDPTTVREVDYADSIRRSLERLDEPSLGRGSEASADSSTRRLVDPSLDRSHLVSVSPRPARSRSARPLAAHQDVVKSIRFSGDGKKLLTASDDYTLKLWAVDSPRLEKTLKGHGGWVVGAEFTEGDRSIVSASNDATIRTWKPDHYVGAFVLQMIDDQTSKAPTERTEAHDGEIWSAQLSADGTKVVTASNDHTARVMDINQTSLAFENELRLQDEILQEGSGFVAMAVHVDPVHSRLFIGNADATIRIWDLERGTQIAEAAGTGLNTSFAVSADGRLLLTGSSSPEINALLWQLDPRGTEPPRIVHRLTAHDQSVTAFAISPDSRFLFTGDRGGFGILWDAQTGRTSGQPVEAFRGYRINAASFSSDGRQLIVAADDEQLSVIDVESRQLVSRMNHDGFVTQVSLSPDGRRALTVSELATGTRMESVATLWDLAAGTPRVLDRVVDRRKQQQQAGSTVRHRITSARFGPSGRHAVVSRAATVDRPATVQTWRIEDFDGIVPGDRILTALDRPAATTTAQENPPTKAWQLPLALGTAEMVLPIDQHTLLTMNNNGAFKWDLRRRQLIKSFRAHAEVTEASFSFDKRFVATASRSVKIWDATTGKSLAKLDSLRPVRSVQFAPLDAGPRSYRLVTAGDDGTVRLWDWDATSETLKSVDQYRVRSGSDAPVIRRARFAPSGKWIWIVGDGGTARLWNLEQPELSRVLDDDRLGDLRCGDVSIDGEYVAAGGTEKKVLLWRLPDAGQRVSSPIEMIGHADTVNDIALLGRGSAMRVMTASSDDSSRVWDPRLGAADADGRHAGARELLEMSRHAGDVTSVDVTEDGRLMMTAGRDGAVILWPAQSSAPNLFDAAPAD